MKFGTKIFFLFLGLSHPVLAKYKTRKRFFIFLNFFTIFFRIFFPWSSMNGIRDWNFILTFSAYLIPFWQKIMVESGFLIFLIFLPFFSEVSCPGREWTEFGTKIFFFSFSTYLILFWVKIIPERGFFIFLLFFHNFLARVKCERYFGTKIFFSLSRPISSSFGLKYCQKEVF